MIKEIVTVVQDIFPIIPLASGRILLAYGTHEIQIDLPVQWWVSYSKTFLYTEEPDGSIPACIGDKNLTGAVLNGTTLIIYADVQSSSATIAWRVY